MNLDKDLGATIARGGSGRVSSSLARDGVEIQSILKIEDLGPAY